MPIWARVPFWDSSYSPGERCCATPCSLWADAQNSQTDMELWGYIKWPTSPKSKKQTHTHPSPSVYTFFTRGSFTPPHPHHQHNQGRVDLGDVQGRRMYQRGLIKTAKLGQHIRPTSEWGSPWPTGRLSGRCEFNQPRNRHKSHHSTVVHCAPIKPHFYSAIYNIDSKLELPLPIRRGLR